MYAEQFVPLLDDSMLFTSPHSHPRDAPAASRIVATVNSGGRITTACALAHLSAKAP
ncbi:hypothetical protein ACWCRF_19710 [Streptomyces sp. NPDC002405]